MAKVEIELGPFIFNPDASPERREEAMKALKEHMVGAQQAMIGEGRKQIVDAFIALLNSLNPDAVKRLEEGIRSLQEMNKPERFRTQFYMLMVDVWQGGMHFALDKRALEAELDLVKVLGFAHPTTEK